MDRSCHIFYDTYSLTETPRFAERVQEAALADGGAFRLRRGGRRLNLLSRRSARLPRHAVLWLRSAGQRAVLLLPSAWNGRLTVCTGRRREVFAAPDNGDLLQGGAKKALVNGFAVIWGEAPAEAMLASAGRLCAKLYGSAPEYAYLRGDCFELAPGFSGTFFPELLGETELRLRFLVRRGEETVSALLPFFSEGEEELTDTACMARLLNWAEEGVSPEIY